MFTRFFGHRWLILRFEHMNFSMSGPSFALASDEL